jgi:hypothetical protein
MPNALDTHFTASTIQCLVRKDDRHHCTEGFHILGRGRVWLSGSSFETTVRIDSIDRGLHFLEARILVGILPLLSVGSC